MTGRTRDADDSPSDRLDDSSGQPADLPGPSDESSRPSNDPPGPTGVPLLGNTLSFLRDPVGFYDRCASFDTDLVRYSIAGTDGYMLSHPADIERVLITDATDFRRAEIIRNTIGKFAKGGLFLAEGEQWRRERIALQPVFYRERIETYAPIMYRYTANRADDWRDGDTIDATAEMRSLTLSILTKTVLDVDIRDQQSAIGEDASVLTGYFDASTVSAYLPLWLPTPANRRVTRAVSSLGAAIEDIIASRRAGDASYDDLLSMLLNLEFEDGSRMSDRDVQDNVLTFLLAGHETTAAALSYALFCLANHPDAQSRLHDELDAVLGGDAPTAPDLFEFEFLDAVFDETLRRYPTVFSTFREPTRDVTFQGHTISKGATISMPQYVVHRDERWYDDPDAFRPSRWTDNFRDELPDYAYFPFGGGPRHCIGMRFALMEAKLVLATLVQRYRFGPGTEPPLDLSMQLTLQPAEPIEIELVER